MDRPPRGRSPPRRRCWPGCDPAGTSTTAKKAPAKRAAKKAPAKKAAAATPADTSGDDAPELEPEAIDLVVEDLELEAVGVDGDPATPKLTVEVQGDEVVVTVGKKRTLDDVDESSFEPVVEAKLEGELKEDQGFTLSAADDADEPEQQVMVAGATADPVKDYLKQIGKVALLNAEQEVTLAKRIEAGLFADESITDGTVK